MIYILLVVICVNVVSLILNFLARKKLKNEKENTSPLIKDIPDIWVPICDGILEDIHNLRIENTVIKQLLFSVTREGSQISSKLFNVECGRISIQVFNAFLKENITLLQKESSWKLDTVDGILKEYLSINKQKKEKKND